MSDEPSNNLTPLAGASVCSNSLGDVGSTAKAYVKSLGLALQAYMAGDPKPLEVHLDHWNVRHSVPSNPLAKQGAVMKMVTARTDLPMAMRQEAKRWLKQRGWSALDDGDVVV